MYPLALLKKKTQNRVLSRLVWSWTYCVAKNDLELLILLPPLIKFYVSGMHRHTEFLKFNLGLFKLYPYSYYFSFYITIDVDFSWFHILVFMRHTAIAQVCKYLFKNLISFGCILRIRGAGSHCGSMFNAWGTSQLFFIMTCLSCLSCCEETPWL